MRDHEVMLAAFCDELARRGLSEHQVAELLDHLQCSIEHKLDAGAEPQQAARDAIVAVGDVVGLTSEYKKEGIMHPLQKLLGIVFVLCVIVVATSLQGAHMTLFVSEFALVPMLMVTGVTVGGLVGSFGLRRTMQLFRAAVLGRRVAADDAPRLQEVCRRAQRLAWTGCLLTLTCSAMHIFSVLDRPSLIGPGLAWSLLAVVYTALLSDLGFGSAERWIEQQAV